VQDFVAILEPDTFYHIYNRANGNELLFKNDNNYRYFLGKYKVYISPIADLYAYCLMPNHFHFLVKIKSQNNIERLILKSNKTISSSKAIQGFEGLSGRSKHEVISLFLTKQWSHFFNGYTQAFNKMFKRKGSLFMRNYKRKKVENEQYLRKLIHYIHYNPVEAKLVDRINDWAFSSYRSIISTRQTDLMRDDVINLFDDLDNFKACHSFPPNLMGIDKLFY